MHEIHTERSLLTRLTSVGVGLTLFAAGLLGSFHFAYAAALSGTNVQPASLIAGSTNTVTISFATATTIPADGRVEVIFPTGYDVSGATGGTCSTMDGTFTTAVSSQTVRIVRVGDGTGQTAAPETCTVGGIVNPTTAGTTGTYTITTFNNVPTSLDTDTAVAGDTIVAATLTSTNVQPTTLRTGSSNTVTVSFTTVNSLENNGKIKVTFPSGFNVASAASGTCSTMDGTFATSVSSQVVTITRQGDGTTETAGAQTCTLTGIVNPSASGAGGTYTITTTNSADATHDTDASVSSDNFSAGSHTTSEPLTYSIDVTSPEEGDEYVPGASVTITWVSGGTGNMSYVNLYYSDDEGSTWETIETNKQNTGSYSWTAPSISSYEVVVRVDGTDLADVLATGESETFAVVSASVSTDDEESQDVVDDSDSEDSEDVTDDSSDYDYLPEGTFVRWESSDAVYYVDASGVRHPFLDAQTFFTYADSFDDVMVLDSSDISMYDMGSPMLPMSGTVLVKVESVNKVYALSEEGDDTVLHWITSEDLAISLYGEDWADYVIDVPVTSWGRFVEGDEIESESDISVDVGNMHTREWLNER